MKLLKITCIVFIIFFSFKICRGQNFEAWNKLNFNPTYNTEITFDLTDGRDRSEHIFNLKGEIKSVYFYYKKDENLKHLNEFIFFEKGEIKYNNFYFFGCSNDSCFSKFGFQRDTVFSAFQLSVITTLGKKKREINSVYNHPQTDSFDSIIYNSASKIFYKYRQKDGTITVHEFYEGYKLPTFEYKLDAISKKIIEKTNFMDFEGRVNTYFEDKTTFSYDSLGRLEEKVELSNFFHTPLTTSTTLEYDNKGNLLKKKEVSKFDLSNTQVITEVQYTYNKFDAAGNWTDRTVTKTVKENKTIVDKESTQENELREIYYW